MTHDLAGLPREAIVLESQQDGRTDFVVDWQIVEETDAVSGPRNDYDEGEE